MYPNNSYPGYHHANAIGAWNKASIPQNSQGIGYAIPYTMPEVPSYVEKAPFANPYGTTVYATMEHKYYRQQYSTAGSQPAQWAHSNFQQYVPAQQYRRSVTECYNRHCPNMPNTARPPPGLKADSVDNTFHASLSMLENPTQNSAAAYTANWVSSTSSIPPELRDEPERDDLAAGASAVFTPPASTFAEQFSNLSVNDRWENTGTLSMQQWPGLEQGRNDGAPGSHGDRRRTEGRERYARLSPKELTWEERIRKGAVQKERIEQRGLERHERTERDSRESNSGGGRHKGQRGGARSGIAAKTERAQREHLSSSVSGERDVAPCRNQMMMRGSRTHGSRQGDKKCHIERTPLLQLRPPPYYRQGIPPLMAQNVYYHSAPNLVPCMAPQDQRFRNTWLDANLVLNYSSVPMVDYAVLAPCCGLRLRPPSRGRSGYRIPTKHSQNAKETSKTRSEDQDSPGADQGGEDVRAGGLKRDESLKVDTEEGSEYETEEQKQKVHNDSMYRPFEKKAI
ncbi:hypothetical protein KIN20_024357 [Parelaphostrongylus tenuis]|uniref:Uncharacterized protein n=1 Tax=Parelaphostrongylus tenuis TaxID=148309 RepID=A0AAD5NAZ7_PARTN|nr:hypothetical protein KIN20_024357 [Parelaphostrongylus tenuis]